MRILGIDTGGTYTDGVILERESKRILAKAKTLTTPHDLVLGIQACLDSLHFEDAEPHIDLVCLSTTLATNAIVEGRGCRAGLVLIGRVPDGTLPVDEYEFLNGRFTIKGTVVEPLEEREVVAALDRMRGKYEALAVSGYASVRNPAHEQMVGCLARDRLGIPVVHGHEVTMALGYYERTVTAVLNARLIPIIQHLIAAVSQVLEAKNIQAPIMVVKGDGSLMQASYALERPVDTILSGPAASVIGGAYLSGHDNAMIVDIGGTTTDIAHIRNGRTRINEDGATVAGWRTRVRAADICTFGLGGDSAIRVEDNGSIEVGPHKVTPYCRSHAGEPQRGFTPTDVLHILGEYMEWDVAEAIRGALGCGNDADVAVDPAPFASLAHQAVMEKLNHCLLEGLRLEESTPQAIVGIGAPSAHWMRKIENLSAIPLCIPEHAEVANAVGAAAGGIFEQSQVLVRRDRIGDQYIVHSTRERLDFPDLATAKKTAERLAAELARECAVKAGADHPDVRISRDDILDENGSFLEFRVTAHAFGYPSSICP
ncbi:MAG: hydantoinase/oxoprolinase family protein [Planctomycetaceae bacterium]|nr:hydantoinase/oxoprolinase family protein [Planctomycetaceae bacterium]